MAKIDLETVRDFLRDYPSLNLLNDNLEQFSEDLMASLLALVISDIKAYTPALSKTISSIPSSILIYGLVAKLLQSEAFLQLRNKVAVADNNNSSTSIFGKEREYLMLADMFEKQFREGLATYAKARFYNTCWGGVSSNADDIETKAILLWPY